MKDARVITHQGEKRLVSPTTRSVGSAPGKAGKSFDDVADLVVIDEEEMEEDTN